MKKIKVFLGGYVNFLNAQNINCRAISEHIDKTRFKVTTMLFWYQDARDFKPIPVVKYFKLRRPARLWRYIVYLRGIVSADVAYLPKGEIDGFCRAVARIFGTKVFTTCEGILNPEYFKGDFERYVAHYSKYAPRLYSITAFLARYENTHHGLIFDKRILYLGVDSGDFINERKKVCGLKNVVFIGNDVIRKNLMDLFDVAAACPDLKFHIVGGNQLKDCTVEEYISRNGLDNVTYHGRLDHTALSRLLAGMDLMYFPSRSEGFPKVHLETACAGVPTLCYGDYGAAEWIDSWRNGIIVNDRDEALDAIRRLQANPALLQRMSAQAVELGKRFDWKNLVHNWEEVIEEIAQG